MSLKGKILENVEVIDTGAKGKNIARAGSFIVLVDNAIPGDVVDVKVLRKRKGFAEGKAIAFHKLSPYRIQPVCNHFDECGGCTWQNMDYQSQLRFKEKMVSDTLQRIGKIPAPLIHSIIPASQTEYYRNRLDFAFSNKRWITTEEAASGEDLKNKPGLGFHISGRFDKVLNLEHCYLQAEPSNKIRLSVREYALENNYPFFDLRQQEGSLRSLIIRTASTGELMVIVIFYKETKDRINQLLSFLKEQFPEITALYYVLNPKANDSVYDLDHHLFSGKPEITEEINGITYRIGPKSFFQTNSHQAKVLFDLALDFADIKEGEVIYDLYTGVGSIALQAAKKAKKVIGIEYVEEAIEYAKINAADNNITNTEFFAGDVKNILTDEFIAEKGKPDLVITDPPRAGMDPPVVKKLLELEAPRIVYVSCNPATQARDLELLKEKYEVKKVQAVDMFPHTYHVESVALLEIRQL